MWCGGTTCGVRWILGLLNRRGTRPWSWRRIPGGGSPESLQSWLRLYPALRCGGQPFVLAYPIQLVLRAFAGIRPMSEPKSPHIPAGKRDNPSESCDLILIYRGLYLDPCRCVLVEQFPGGCLIAFVGVSSICLSKDKFPWLRKSTCFSRGSSGSRMRWVVVHRGEVGLF